MISSKRFLLLFAAISVLALVANPPAAGATPDFSAIDTVKAGRFDNGKMWAFEYPPLEYLAETYDFRPDSAWFERARLSVLRIPGCSASFISPTGLVVTNHHCVRSRVSAVSEPGENLLDNGFYARSLDEERRIPGYYADQLIAIEDVTDDVDAAKTALVANAFSGDTRDELLGEIEARIRSAHSSVSNLQVQIIPLYNGGRYSAYVFRRYTDIRLVFAVELQLGFFGGDADNFTYPRYALDYSFLRIYDEDGTPLESPNYFGFSDAGVEEGDLVFVIGNPGSTSRQATVSQLEFFRDVLVDHTLRVLNRRLIDFRAFYDEDPVAGEALNLRNTIFSISNSQKAYTGRDEALKDPMLIARRADGERQFRAAIEADPDLSARFGNVIDDIAAIQTEKRAFGHEYGAFRYIEISLLSSATIRRGIQAARYLRAVGVDSAAEASASRALMAVRDRPDGLEKRLLIARLDELSSFLGEDDATVRRVMAGLSAAERANQILNSSILASEERTRVALDQGTLSASDPGVAMVDAFFDRYNLYRVAFNQLQARERELQSEIGKARFEVYGVTVPSDATFSPRFTDGIVKGYSYNGTLAPPYTTLYGLMDHFYSYGGRPDWTLPAKWRNPPADLQLGTPLNFVSTSDTIGGNSGSPAVTRNLEIVGLNFDRNIEGLSRDYIYLPDRGRNIMVDMRAVKETLDKVYDADRIVLELTTGMMVESEEAADAIQDQN
ncbi:MAG: S46 family peptidase [Rhodothermia bacterium]|nr:MAG: S46 family peptidase [Rhodothermia bacterium]